MALGIGGSMDINLKIQEMENEKEKFLKERQEQIDKFIEETHLHIAYLTGKIEMLKEVFDGDKNE